MKLKDRYGTIWDYELHSTLDGGEVILKSPNEREGHSDYIFKTSLPNIREKVKDGLYTIVEGSFEGFDGHDDKKNTLEKIKEFTNKHNVEITITEGIYRVEDCDISNFYEAKDDEALVKIMDALITLEEAFVS
jgi:hypothetical protein